MGRVTLKKRKVRFNTVHIKFFDKRESISEWRKGENEEMTPTKGPARKSILKKRDIKEPLISSNDGS
jgi:hypothetical protein